MIRVAVGEHELLVQEGIRQVLASTPDIQLVAMCPTILNLERAVNSLDVDVVITAIRIQPGSHDDGVGFAARLRQTHPKIGVIILSRFLESMYAVRLFEHGSARRAYLLKDRVSHRDLGDAITAVAAGGSMVDPKVVDVLVADRRAEAESPLRVLTPRELEVLSLVAEGRSNSSIANQLYLTKRAVEKHINAVFAKLGLPDESISSRRVRAMLLFLAENRPVSVPG